MRHAALAFLLLLTAFSIAIHAQQTSSDSSSLTDQPKLGRRVFEQRCGVCHTLVAATGKTYGPTLYKELIVGNEDGIREFIKNGSPGKMPGFKYGLEPSEIDAIVEYLKTVPRPRPPVRTASGN